MSTQTLNMDNGMPDNSTMLNHIGMDFPCWAGGSPSFNSIASQPFDIGSKTFPNAPQEGFDQFSLVDAISSFTDFQPPRHQQQPSPAAIIDPMDTWQSQDSALSIADSKGSTQSGLPGSPIATLEEDELRQSTPGMSQSPPMSDSSLRARHAANQRHNKVQKVRRDSHQSADTGTAADTKKDRLREKNKVAAAKCRRRKRKQAQSIQEKGARLSDANAELKASVQALRGVLSELRAIALHHQGCNCQVASYNCKQAARVAADYSSNNGSPPYRGQVGRPPT